MFPIASSTAIVTQMLSDGGVILALVVGAIITAGVALVGVGYGWRKFQKLLGKKF